MKQYVIDTNALLSFVTDRNLSQQAVMAGVFEQVAALQAALLCPQNVIAEFVYVMETVYHQPKPSIKSIITDFIAMPGVAIVDKTNFEAIFSLWPEVFDDFGDAVVASCAQATKGASVITFDRRFMRKLASCRIAVMESKSS
ncbi:MAG: PIN domain-containing protein [Nitrospirae bacterium]|nr:PIN domain-containing protein [Nitrospirota bacterium]